ncbi:MAG: biotin carboxylase N-terminal domain-containing protein [Pseudomonadota bacterium]
MFSRLLIANRGEIAVRIMKTARRMEIDTVAVYSEADANALHVKTADAAVLVGPADPARSYLDPDRIIHAAREAGAEAIHPGYGFLSENAPFAQKCEAAGLLFVGPPATAIAAMGSKAQAKTIMERAGVPVVPGYHGESQDGEFLKRKAYEIGYPVLIKAVAGGGGKGMRRVDKVLEFDDALAAAKREAQAAFGDERVLVEKFIPRPRHIEVQVFADRDGRTVSLHERDCSLQRRHQKVIEEAPAPGMTPALRAAMGEAAVTAARAVDYVGAGTVEFILEGGEALGTDNFYFMEMNTRLQVEHPVTEAVMGFDLVEWQLRVAAGEALPPGEPLQPRGHAVEARLYAEDPDNGFLPSSGEIVALSFPSDVRIDTGVEAGDTVSPYYDPMIAKIIASGPDRAAAFQALGDTLAGTVAIGPRTNLAFLRQLASHPDVLAGRHDTGLVEREIETLTAGSVGAQAIADAAAYLLEKETPPPASAWRDPWDVLDGFRLTGDASQSVALAVDGRERIARVTPTFEGQTVVVDGVLGRANAGEVVDVDGAAFALEAGRAVRVEVVDQLARVAEDDTAGQALAPMHGRIVAIYVEPGAPVAAGDRLFAMEAMKMEHVVKAASEGTVKDVRAAPGDQVPMGAEIIVLEMG